MPKKNVLLINADLEIVETYPSVKDAARVANQNYNTFVYHTSRLVPEDGMLYVMEYIWESFSDDEKEAIFRPSTENPGPKLESYKRSIKRKNEVNHVIPYDVLYNSICTTPCPFLTDKGEEDRPKVGSANCNKCRFFIHKDKASHVVLCGFNKFGIINQNIQRKT